MNVVRLPQTTAACRQTPLRKGFRHRCSYGGRVRRRTSCFRFRPGFSGQDGGGYGAIAADDSGVSSNSAPSDSECSILMDGAVRYLNDRSEKDSRLLSEHSALQLQSSERNVVFYETNSPVNCQFCKDLGGRVSES